MATNIFSDDATLIPVEFDNLGGQAVAVPAGATATASNDNPTIAACTVETAADGSMVLVISPVKPPPVDGSMLNSSVTATWGTTTVTTEVEAFTFTTDPNAVNARLRTDQITTRPLP